MTKPKAADRARSKKSAITDTSTSSGKINTNQNKRDDGASHKDNPNIDELSIDRNREAIVINESLSIPINRQSSDQLHNLLYSSLTALFQEIDSAHPDLSAEERNQELVRRVMDAASRMKNDERLQHLLEIPKEAAQSYIPRKSGKASAFLKEHWGKYIEAGVCFRPDIKRLDPKLEMALANEFRGRTNELRAILPTQTDAADARLASEFGGPVRPEDRKAAMTASSVAKRVKTLTH